MTGNADACIDQFAWGILLDVIQRQVREEGEKRATKARADRVILTRKRELRRLKELPR